jgi:hypothetical protein
MTISSSPTTKKQQFLAEKKANRQLKRSVQSQVMSESFSLLCYLSLP